MLIHGVILLMSNFFKRRVKMQTTKYTCDHCGKEIDNFNDYTDTELDFGGFYKSCDFCCDCYNKLVDYVSNFVVDRKEE